VADVWAVLTFAHSHGCAQRGRVTTRRLLVPEDGAIDVPRVVCAAPGPFAGVELEQIGFKLTVPFTRRQAVDA
jgi:hypothetical protein